MSNQPKNIKRQLRAWARKAYECELDRELRKLDQSFEGGRQGDISSGELSHRVHKYEIGPSRDLYKRYNYGEIELNVAYAILVGILDENEVPEALLDALGGPINFFRSMKEKGELRLPE